MGLFRTSPKERAKSISRLWKEIKKLLQKNREFYRERNEERADIDRNMVTFRATNRALTLNLTHTILTSTGQIITGIDSAYNIRDRRDIRDLNHEIVGEIDYIEKSLRK